MYEMAAHYAAYREQGINEWTGEGFRNCLKTILMPKIVALWLPGTKVPVYSQSPRWGSNRGVPEELVIVARQFIAGKRGHSCYDFVRFQDFETLSSSLSLVDGQDAHPHCNPAFRAGRRHYAVLLP